MGILSKIKRYLPVSSRSFHAAEEKEAARLARIEEMQSVIFARIEQADIGINDNINYKFHDVTLPRISSLEEKVAVHAAHSKLYFQELIRREGESSEDAKRRFFASIPPVSGEMRVWQLANVRLAKELDSICRKLDIKYWGCFGTLVAAMSRNGFIPWDDDIDVCMMRDDVERLKQSLEENNEYQLTLVYDRHVYCRQYRFSSRDPLIPCFVDVCVWDWAYDSSLDSMERMRELRLALMAEFDDSISNYTYWDERKWLFADQGYVIQGSDITREEQDDLLTDQEIKKIDKVFEKYRGIAEEEGIVVPRGHRHDNVCGLAYGLDNIYDAPWRRTIFPVDMVFPVSAIAFETMELMVPNDSIAMCDECYPGWPYLPNDILGHAHFARETLSDVATLEQLERFATS